MMLPVLLLRAWPGHVRVHADMLLELLKGVVRTLGNTLKARVEVRVGDMTVREEGGGRYGVIRRKAMERIRQHVVRRGENRYIRLGRQLDRFAQVSRGKILGW